MTEQDFVAFIIDHPADDAPRLIFADWLEENGRHERAEFIRAQCVLARGPSEETDWCHHDLTSPPECRGCALRRRERELLTPDNFDRWSVPLPVTVAQNMRRGFVASVACTLADWLAHGSVLARSAPLERVRLIDCFLDRAGGNGKYFVVYPAAEPPPFARIGLHATKSATLAALDAACLDWARAQR